MTHPLAALFESAEGHQPEAAKTEPTILVHTLKEIFEAFQAGCVFQPGALVTPRRGMPLMGHGDPHLVLERIEPPVRVQGANQISGMNYYGRFDMRVLHELNGHLMAHTVESWMFEPYVPTVAPGSTRN